MNRKLATELLERGAARCVYTSLLVLVHDDSVWYSFDGLVWTETKDEGMKKAAESDD